MDSTRNVAEMADLDARVRDNQRGLAEALKTRYDFIVCGAGSSGSVVARRLAENDSVSVLLLEAGSTDDVPGVMDADQWRVNLGSERDWGFRAQPNPHLNGRVLPLSMGKVLGGGSSINVMVWSRGHKNDWDYFAAEANDPAWNYDSILKIYRRIEDWKGVSDPLRRGTEGLVYVQPAPDPNPIAPAMLEGARGIGIPVFEDQNGSLMEGDGGAAVANVRLRNGRRLSIFRTYAYPYMDRPNLTVLTGALVSRIAVEHNRATGVDVIIAGKVHRIAASCEIVLSLGAINTPKVLMQSGIGDESELKRAGIEVVQHLPGVGQNLQDHPLICGCVWEYSEPVRPRNNGSEATLFWKSDPAIDTPDLQPMQSEFPVTSLETARYLTGAPSWSILPCVVRPRSRGHIRLTGPNSNDPVEIHANMLSDPTDLKVAVRGVELCREIGNSNAMRPFVKREAMPGDLQKKALEAFVREAAMTTWHMSCSAKMGRDHMAVVDGQLRVYGIDNLRVADASIMPRVTTGNTMAPCVVIGERAAQLLIARQ